ncbi:M3 family oligoendopeptidase [Fictibacillus gelatini]|uniref:M3 family oligoendopeptidase n=1 Tax=Fictibacillus gelatini TaxID=225985 RepID=UPI0003FA924C|nr:M3 family oligoendopeptidase [Fictibacillus gelatini]
MIIEGLRESWDLESIFPGGSDSKELLAAITKAEQEIATLKSTIKDFTYSQEGFIQFIKNIEQTSMLLSECISYVGCLAAQNVKDKAALSLRGKLEAMFAQFETIMVMLDEAIMQIEEDDWKSLTETESLKGIAFSLKERRKNAADKLPFEQEALINDLSVDGYHSWSTLYDRVVGRMKVETKIEGKEESLSIGQAENRMTDPDRKVREHVFQSYSKAWEEEAEFCAEALNHISGFRNSVYKNREWSSVLKEPLSINRMSDKTLEAMWEAIVKSKEVFVEYLKKKAELLGIEKLSWYDVEAPISKTSSKMTYDEAANFIIEQFAAFSPKMAKFAEIAFVNGWIEAEDRSGKRPGGFCTGFPLKQESRIFMTFSGTADNVSTLAHELGHGFHSYVMKDMPYFAQNYAMNVAETASTFAEMVVADAAVGKAKSKEEKIALLEGKLQNAVAFFMNIHARFLFETRFYEERKKGLVPVERLNELMLEAQREAYCGALDQYHPYFWASKLHFYITDVPFYNFPYTFGYLFSASIYAKAKEEGEGFEDKYIALLRDTGSMTVEELALKHLNEDITKPEFWTKGIKLAEQDVKEFLELTR